MPEECFTKRNVLDNLNNANLFESVILQRKCTMINC